MPGPTLEPATAALPAVACRAAGGAGGSCSESWKPLICVSAELARRGFSPSAWQPRGAAVTSELRDTSPASSGGGSLGRGRLHVHSALPADPDAASLRAGQLGQWVSGSSFHDARVQGQAGGEVEASSLPQGRGMLPGQQLASWGHQRTPANRGAWGALATTANVQFHRDRRPLREPR